MLVLLPLWVPCSLGRLWHIPCRCLYSLESSLSLLDVETHYLPPCVIFLAMCLQILFWILSLLSIWYSLCTSWYTWQLCTGLWGSVHFLLCLTALHISPGLSAHPGMPDGFAQVSRALCTFWYAWWVCTGLRGAVHTLVCLTALHRSPGLCAHSGLPEMACKGFWSSVHILVWLITLYKSSKLFLFSFTHLCLCF